LTAIYRRLNNDVKILAMIQGLDAGPLEEPEYAKEDEIDDELINRVNAEAKTRVHARFER
jgi:hypothetical protein